jgi:hypothetical protein
MNHWGGEDLDCPHCGEPIVVGVNGLPSRGKLVSKKPGFPKTDQSSQGSNSSISSDSASVLEPDQSPPSRHIMNNKSNASEGDLYLLVEGELNAGFRDEGLMHKAKIESTGDPSKSLSLYYRYRVASLQADYKYAHEAQKKHQQARNVRRYVQHLKDPESPENSDEGAVDKGFRILGMTAQWLVAMAVILPFVLGGFFSFMGILRHHTEDDWVVSLLTAVGVYWALTHWTGRVWPVIVFSLCVFGYYGSLVGWY